MIITLDNIVMHNLFFHFVVYTACQILVCLLTSAVTTVRVCVNGIVEIQLVRYTFIRAKQPFVNINHRPWYKLTTQQKIASAN